MRYAMIRLDDGIVENIIEALPSFVSYYERLLVGDGDLPLYLFHELEDLEICEIGYMYEKEKNKFMKRSERSDMSGRS